MNREQMIAWLTLEGWEPNGENGHWWAGCQKDTLNVYYNGDSEMVEEVHLGRPKDHPVCSWDGLPGGTIAKLYQYIQEEKDHEPR